MRRITREATRALGVASLLSLVPPGQALGAPPAPSVPAAAEPRVDLYPQPNRTPLRASTAQTPDFRTSQGILRPETMNHKGVFTRDREPKAAASFLRERWGGAAAAARR